jgi:acetoin utilization deacetylase AcuC-like enzyme
VVSCGFDGHKDDPVRGACLDEDLYGIVAEDLVSLSWAIHSCRGRVVSVLEGGYDVKEGGALERSTRVWLEKLWSSRRPSDLTEQNLSRHSATCS